MTDPRTGGPMTTKHERPTPKGEAPCLLGKYMQHNPSTSAALVSSLNYDYCATHDCYVVPGFARLWRAAREIRSAGLRHRLDIEAIEREVPIPDGVGWL